MLAYLGSKHLAFLSNYNSTIRELLCSVPHTVFASMAARVLMSAVAMLPASRELDEIFARLPLNQVSLCWEMSYLTFHLAIFAHVACSIGLANI